MEVHGDLEVVQIAAAAGPFWTMAIISSRCLYDAQKYQRFWNFAAHAGELLCHKSRSASLRAQARPVLSTAPLSSTNRLRGWSATGTRFLAAGHSGWPGSAYALCIAGLS